MRTALFILILSVTTQVNFAKKSGLLKETNFDGYPEEVKNLAKDFKTELQQLHNKATKTHQKWLESYKKAEPSLEKALNLISDDTYTITVKSMSESMLLKEDWELRFETLRRDTATIFKKTIVLETQIGEQSLQFRAFYDLHLIEELYEIMLDLLQKCNQSQCGLNGFGNRIDDLEKKLQLDKDYAKLKVDEVLNNIHYQANRYSFQRIAVPFMNEIKTSYENLYT